MEESGFNSGVYSPCVFYNPVRNISAVVHGDDFTMLGKTEDLDWFWDQIQNKFEVNSKPDSGLEKKIRVSEFSIALLSGIVRE